MPVEFRGRALAAVAALDEDLARRVRLTVEAHVERNLYGSMAQASADSLLVEGPSFPVYVQTGREQFCFAAFFQAQPDGLVVIFELAGPRRSHAPGVH